MNLIDKDREQLTTIQASQSNTDNKIQKLEKSIELVITKSDKALGVSKNLEDLNNKFTTIKSAMQELESSAHKIQNFKEKIDGFEKKLQDITKINVKNEKLYLKLDNQNQKIQNVHTSFANLKTFQSEVLSTTNELEGRSKDLQKKLDFVDSLTDKIDNLGINTDSLKKTYQNIESDVSNIQDQYKNIDAIKKQVLEIKKIEPMIDSQLKQVATHREALVKLTSDAKVLSEEFEDKILSVKNQEGIITDTRSIVGKKTKLSGSATQEKEEVKKIIIDLYHKHKYSVDQIAQHCGLDTGYVELIIDNAML